MSIRGILGFETNEVGTHDIDGSSYEVYKRKLRESMYQSALLDAKSREAKSVGNLDESRELQKQSIDRILNDGDSYVEKQSENLLNQQAAKSASLSTQLPTGANATSLARDVVRSNNETAQQGINNANIARIAEERQRQELLSGATQRLSTTDLTSLNLADAQRRQAETGLLGLSGLVTQSNITREQDELRNFLETEKLQQAAVDAGNKITGNIWKGVGTLATPFLTPAKKAAEVAAGAAGAVGGAVNFNEAQRGVPTNTSSPSSYLTNPFQNIFGGTKAT